ncbi:MAG: hypothetical protein N4A35_09185 [Flavobacteriales bacterium]|jgi:Ca2+-binding EF-hand superfamily protein|nr:hypothetical protein [Flavobacteriales bacterium]
MKSTTCLPLFFIGVFAISCSTQDKVITYDESTPRSSQNKAQRERPNIFEMDTNNDGLLSKSEVKGPIANDFDQIDANGDGYISKEEFEKAPKPDRNGGPGGGRPPQR